MLDQHDEADKEKHIMTFSLTLALAAEEPKRFYAYTVCISFLLDRTLVMLRWVATRAATTTIETTILTVVETLLEVILDGFVFAFCSLQNSMCIVPYDDMAKTSV